MYHCRTRRELVRATMILRMDREGRLLIGFYSFSFGAVLLRTALAVTRGCDLLYCDDRNAACSVVVVSRVGR